MPIQHDVIAYLLTVDAITDTAGVGTRIRSVRRQQSDALPGITVRLLDNEDQKHLGGGSGLAESAVEIESYGETPLQAATVDEQVRLALDSYEGAMGSSTVRETNLTSAIEDYDQNSDGSDKAAYIVLRIATIWHFQSVAN